MPQDRNYHSLTHLLTRVKSRDASASKKRFSLAFKALNVSFNTFKKWASSIFISYKPWGILYYVAQV